MTDRNLTYAKKSFGQNFLSDPNYIAKIIKAARVTNAETVVEIGPGRGAITEELIEQARSVIAIEIDRELVTLLEKRFQGRRNFKLYSADAIILDYSDLAKEAGTKLKLVANLPYNISTAILQRLIAYRNDFSEMVLMFQREVVERMTAEPGNSERGYLTVLVQAFMSVERLFDVPPVAFRPSPKVWSSVVRLTARSEPAVSAAQEERFSQLVSAAFRHKRKTILNNLKSSVVELNLADPAGALAKAGIAEIRRPEALSVNEWASLADCLF